MSTPTLRTLVDGRPEFDETLRALARRGDTDLDRVEGTVRQILSDVRQRGDAAVREYVERFENRRPEALMVRDYGGAEALESLTPSLRQALTVAAERIRRYHEHQKRQLTTFEYVEDGVMLSSRVTPVQRAGIYAPGGKACYPSSVLMCAVPAQVAGVPEIYLASPDTSVEVRAACHLAGVTALIDFGGAQAIAALAYGTESVPAVDKIVGPGNIYVAAAKRLVFGQVDIDSIAGPSEILVLADETADPEVVAADLLSQAEHDEDAYALLIAVGARVAEAVSAAVARQLASLPETDARGRPRRAIAEESVRRHGTALVVESEARLIELANVLAAEHVSVQTNAARSVADRITRAGALFVGHNTPEAAGDYLAGPSHVLPTGGAARYGAPLGVYDFVSRSSLIGYELSALAAQAADITTFARAEGLEAHARAVEVRLGRK
ncbi:MAG TPA: histidinol dehydrogenase [Polyangiaceae bacterium]|nr:histidinol dehydrogenase [Polyangiaceae bacterium]